MKKCLFLLLALLPILLTSCEFDDNGKMHLSGFGWFLIIGFVLFLFFVAATSNGDTEATKAKMKEEGMDYSQFISLGAYGGGHPNIDKTIENVYCRKEDNTLALYCIPVMNISMPDRISNGEIPIEDINDITIEDATSIEKKITVGRILLVGIFALGWKKKKKNELAFLVIEWKKGKFEHSTTFSFEGKEAFQNANTARNKLISYCE
ncbi:MAG: hypothetical protein HUK10_01385 [Bacteroides heparinolyticus]|nr:hypothetical protein [Bacteroides heparinolyticus]